MKKAPFDLFCDLLTNKAGLPLNQRFVEFGFGRPFEKNLNTLPINGKIIELWQKSVVITRYAAVAGESQNVETPLRSNSNDKSWLNCIDAIIGVEGESMANKIFEGDELFCKKIEYDFKFNGDYKFENDKTIYVIAIRGYGSPMIKYVKYRAGDKELTLISENEAHKPFKINLQDIETLWKVIKVVKNPRDL